MAQMTKTMANTPNPTPLIALPLYPGVQMAAVQGLEDLFTVAARMAARPLDIRRIDPDAPPATTRCNTIILAPSLGGARGDGPAARPLLAWLAAQHRAGATLASVCAGAFWLGHAGLLDARRATTHWALGTELVRRFPLCRPDTDQVLIDLGDIVTAGGLMAWVDLGLALIERQFGAPVKTRVARYFLIDTGLREQRYYRSFAPPRDHGDAPILALQDWLEQNPARPLTLAQMATHAGLAPRTLQRRFQHATGFSPNRYLQHLRVELARDRLEHTREPFNRITWAAGYDDPATFAQLFTRLMGLSPQAYRKRFAPGPSSH